MYSPPIDELLIVIVLTFQQNSGLVISLLSIVIFLDSRNAFGPLILVFFIVILIDKWITDTKAWNNKRKYIRKLGRENRVKELATETVTELIAPLLNDLHKEIKETKEDLKLLIEDTKIDLKELEDNHISFGESAIDNFEGVYNNIREIEDNISKIQDVLLSQEDMLLSDGKTLNRFIEEITCLERRISVLEDDIIVTNIKEVDGKKDFLKFLKRGK